MHPRLPLQSLGIIVTSECNLACAYCYQNAKAPGRIGWTDLRDALQLALNSTSPTVRISFTGGEPLLAFDVIRRAVNYVEERRPKHMALRFHLCTNGMSLGTRETLFLDQHGFSIQLSFDGVEGAQDVRGKGTFERLDRLLVRLRLDHPSLFFERFHVATMILPGTVHLLRRSVADFLRRGVRDVALAPATVSDEGWSPERIRQLDVQVTHVMRQSIRQFQRLGRVSVRLFRQLGDAYAGVPKCDSLCGVGSPTALVVDTTGRLSGCLPLVGSYQRFPPTELARRVAAVRLCRASGLRSAAPLTRYRADLLRTLAFDRREGKRSSYGECGDCLYANDCRVCPMTIVLQPGAGDPHRIPDYVCAFNRIVSRCRRRFPRQRRPCANDRETSATGSGL